MLKGEIERDSFLKISRHREWRAPSRRRGDDDDCRVNVLSVLLLCSLSGLLACEEVVEGIGESLREDPQRSVCQAYCEWAVGCQAGSREVENEALIERCVTETKAVNGDCEQAETEGLDPLTSQGFESCVEEIDEAASADQCEAFTGNAVEINMATPPQSCARRRLRPL